jgi:hypothetical protein
MKTARSARVLSQKFGDKVAAEDVEIKEAPRTGARALEVRERGPQKLTRRSASSASEPAGSTSRRLRRLGHFRRISGSGH